MTIKAFAFRVQSMLRDSHGTSIKRSHVHEVLAALFGCASYAALTSQRLLAQHDGSLPGLNLDVAKAAARAVELGYVPPAPPLIATLVARAVEAEKIYVLPLDEALIQLYVDFDDHAHLAGDATSGQSAGMEDREDGDDDDDDDDDDSMFLCLDVTSPLLLESLTRMADAGNAVAHVAVTRVYEEMLTDMNGMGTSPDGADGRYWFEQQEAGRVLDGVEAEWADGYFRKQEALRLRNKHLRQAVELGNAQAALRQAEIDPTDENFELAASRAGLQEAARLARIAMFLGRDADALPPLRALAMAGDTSAMRELAGGLETDLRQAWTWVHLAQLLGVDVTAYHAVDDDGLPADADEAGPLYAEGGFELDDLSDAENLEALQAARQIHAKLLRMRV